jgi:hypothetical protein
MRGTTHSSVPFSFILTQASKNQAKQLAPALDIRSYLSKCHTYFLFEPLLRKDAEILQTAQRFCLLWHGFWTSCEHILHYTVKNKKETIYSTFLPNAFFAICQASLALM